MHLCSREILKSTILFLIPMMFTGCGSQHFAVKNGAGIPYGQAFVLDSAGPQPVGETEVLQPASAKQIFSWDNATVYFVMTDRFFNGNPDNDRSYGRRGDGGTDIGTFHGGDLAGLTLKIREGYFNMLGVNALWITAPYQQMLGWVVGGNNDFKHYGYHGYYALDFTVLDENMGTPEALREFIDTAHDNGIRVIFDVVMNHPGYADHKSLATYGPDVLEKGWERANVRNYHDFIGYNNPNFKDWWGDWVRAGLPGSANEGAWPLESQLAYLPDFRTEMEEPATYFPTFLLNKADSNARPIEGYTIRQYLIKWLTDWVREYGVDGFRCDTAMHVEKSAWRELKQAGVSALRDWKSRNPDKALDELDFWMTGEHWGHGVDKDAYFNDAFDSMINFDFQREAGSTKHLAKLYQDYADAINNDASFNVLSYISSHDTLLFGRKQLYTAGISLLLAPGGVQIYYGDETARPRGSAPAADPQQATRSDMNWENIDEGLLQHWQLLGLFRHRHSAVGSGRHKTLDNAPFTFSRISSGPDGADKVVVALDVVGTDSISVSGVFNNGDIVRDAYTGLHWPVEDSKVRLQSHPNGVVLLESYLPQ